MQGAMRTAGLEADHLTEGGSGAEHGGLVQKILDTKKRDETSSTSAAKTAVTIVCTFKTCSFSILLAPSFRSAHSCRPIKNLDIVVILTF